MNSSGGILVFVSSSTLIKAEYMADAALKAARAAKKQAVSLRVRNLRRLMAEDETVSVKTKKSELKLAFREFENVAL